MKPWIVVACWYILYEWALMIPTGYIMLFIVYTLYRAFKEINYVDRSQMDAGCSGYIRS